MPKPVALPGECDILRSGTREEERPAAHDVRRAVLNEDPAATYSPRQLPTKYHRRYAA